MTFLYPLGLLGLIGVPILIIIYIIKNKYMEQTVPSTYIWTLSEKFLKRKRPISKLAGIISLILQILAVIFISFSVAHPVVVLKGQAKEYCFILDSSGSMNFEYDNTTRFEQGKKEIENVIRSAKDGSTYSLVCLGDSATTVYNGETDKKQAIALLKDTKPSFLPSDSDLALSTAQALFNENNSYCTYFVTDKQYTQTKNVTVINVGAEEENYAISEMTCVAVGEGFAINGTIIAYGQLDKVNVEIYLDGNQEVVASTEVSLSENKGEFSVVIEKPDYTYVKAVIKEQDSLIEDNSYVLYNIDKENEYTALIVSKEDFFLKSFVKAIGGKVETCLPEEYQQASGYDLYIFDGYSPSQLPKDGAVWLFGVNENIENSGFSVQGEVTFSPHVQLDITTSTETSVQQLIKNVSNKERISITKYVKYGLYRNFTTLYSYKNIPIIFTGVNTYGYREVVFSFDIHDSNLPVLYDFPVLMSNLWEYSFPAVVEKVVYSSGEEVQINAIPNCLSIRVDSPSGEVSYLEIGSGASIFKPQEVGVYEITLTASTTTKKYYVYVTLPESEVNPLQTENEFIINGEQNSQGLDGIEDIILIAFILLAVAFVSDWMVYCYDKYQLR